MGGFIIKKIFFFFLIVLLFSSMSLVCAEENNTDTILEDVNIDANDVSLYYKNGTRLNVELSDANNNPLSNQSIVFNINGIDYTRNTDDGGSASIAINLVPGSYLTNIRFLGNDNYLPANKTVNINVLSTIEGNNLVKYYKNASQYYATFLDGSGEVLDFEDVIFNINGVFYTRQTDQNGVAKLNINLNSGNYIITAYNPRDGLSYANYIRVLPTINGSDLVKIFRDNHQYWVTVRDFKGNLLSYKDVEFNVNGVFYNRLSERTGNAKLNINLNAGKYIITAYNKITGEQMANTIVVYPDSPTTLNTKNYVFKENDDDTIEATLTNQLNYGVAGETIDLTIGNKKYSAVTDDFGVATFGLNLNQGNYSLTFNHNASSIYGASSVKSTVETYDGIKVTTRCYDEMFFENATYSVNLYDENNKEFSNQTVYMQVGSNLYSAVTDDDGVARFDIDADPGVYNAKIFFNKTGYKFNKEFRELIILENTWTTLIPLTSNVKEGIGEKFGVRLSVDSVYNLPNKEVIFEINGKNYTRITDDDGVAYLTINLKAGTYPVSYYYYGDDFFVGNFNSSVLTVIPRVPTKLTALSGSTIHKNSGVTYDIELRSDNPLCYKEVTVKIGSKTFTQNTDGNGVIHLDISAFDEGTYTVEYSFAGDSIYEPSAGSVNFEITPQIPYGFGYWVRYSDMYDLNLASLASLGTNNVFLHCYAFTAYGESNVASWIRQASSYGINVHIWMQVAYDGSWNAISNKDGSYNYGLINSKVNEAKYYASIPGVAGVHFDYLRFGGTAYKFPKAAESINYFVKTAVSAVKSVNPNCLVSAALMPEPSNMLYYDGQDYSTLTKYLDFVLPMVYKGNYEQNTQWIQSITKWFVDNSNGAQVWTGLQAYNSDEDVTRLSVSELSGDAQASLNGGASGVVMFRWGVTNFINFNNLKVR